MGRAINASAERPGKDRIKDRVKAGTEWIRPQDLERLINQHAAVRSVAVVGIADRQWGERPMALVVCEPGQYLDRKILEAHLQAFVERGRINPWAIPKQFKFVTQIPQAGAGKRDRQ
ncbi:Long-chain-fatty-acid--CoA ligase [compost metagenome]